MKLFTVQGEDLIKHNKELQTNMPSHSNVKGIIEVDRFEPQDLMKAWFAYVYSSPDSWIVFGNDFDVKQFDKNDYAVIHAWHSGVLNEHHVTFNVKKINLGGVPHADAQAIVNL